MEMDCSFPPFSDFKFFNTSIVLRNKMKSDQEVLDVGIGIGIRKKSTCLHPNETPQANITL